jgi:hypothetical protein
MQALIMSNTVSELLGRYQKLEQFTQQGNARVTSKLIPHQNLMLHQNSASHLKMAYDRHQSYLCQNPLAEISKGKT